MSTSGTTTFNLSIDEIIAEAFERCGMQITNGNQLKSARRSLNLLFMEWASRGLNLWTIEEEVLVLSSPLPEYNLPLDTVDVLSAVIRDLSQGSSIDISIERISRSEYLAVPNKTVLARPAQFYVQRTIQPKLFLYPAPGGGGGPYEFRYNRIRRIEDAGDYTNTADVDFRFLPCLIAGLAYQLSLKYAAERTTGLKQLYEEEFARAASEDRDRASFFCVPEVGT
jgi:hypothetical protein